MDLHELERPSNVLDESPLSVDKDFTVSPEPIVAKGPMIQVMSRKDDQSGQGLKIESEPCKAQCREKVIPRPIVNNSTIKPDYSDLQMITTKEDFEKLFKETRNLRIIENNVESTVDTKLGNHLNQITSQSESKNTSTRPNDKQECCNEQKFAPSLSSCNLSLEEESSASHSLDKSDDNSIGIGPLPKLKSATGTKGHNVNTISSGRIKSKSKESVLPFVKSKFNPGSLQFIKQAIRGIIFSGWIGEREYVDKIKAYRDIIEVDEWEETFNHKLKAIVNNISGVKEKTKWINITAPCSSPCYHLWVLLDSAPFPGHYWFQIEDVIVENEFGLRIIVKILREIQPFDGESFSEREKRIKGDINISSEEWKNWLLAISNLKFKDVLVSMLTIFAPSNLNSLFRLTVVLCVTLVVAGAKFLQESWHFMLRLLRELGIFVHHATPFLQSVLNFIEKLIGGFYILLAMLYRDLRKPSLPPPPPFESYHLPIGPPQNHITFPAQRSTAPRRTAPSAKYVPPQSWVYKDE